MSASVVNRVCGSGAYAAIGAAVAMPWNRSLPTTPTTVQFVPEADLLPDRILLLKEAIRCRLIDHHDRVG
jgi:hypothetical protein